eukprot:6439684-Pyramimonas_sp.AAC.1
MVGESPQRAPKTGSGPHDGRRGTRNGRTGPPEGPRKASQDSVKTVQEAAEKVPGCNKQSFPTGERTFLGHSLLMFHRRPR